MMLKVFSTVLVALLLSHPGASARTCKTQTLLRVEGRREFKPFNGHELPFHLEEEYVVTQGGTGVVFSDSDQLPPVASGPRVAFGQAKPASLKALVNGLAANQVETQTSCVRVNHPQSFPDLIYGTYKVSWYRPDGSKNSFQIVFADPGASALPECGVEAINIENAIAAFASALATKPATRFCP